MELKLSRDYKKDKYTIGRLYINNKLFCNTIEDKCRGLSSNMSVDIIKGLKVYGETAIPTGTYEIDLNTISPKFKDKSWAKPYGGKIPRLLNVKGFEGILIHPGNTAQDSYGCLLCGLNTKKGMVTNSTEYFHKLMKELLKAKMFGEKITITIE